MFLPPSHLPFQASNTRRGGNCTSSAHAGFNHRQRTHLRSPHTPVLSSLACLRAFRAQSPSRRQLLAGSLVLQWSSPALAVASLLNPSNATATAAYVEEIVVVKQEQRVAEQHASTSAPSSSGHYTPTRVTATGRIVAIGDLHGDWRKAVESLLTAGVITVLDNDSQDIVWIGEDTVVVQLGDVMDRGDHEIAIVMLLRHLHEQAQQQGGAVYMLNGNHESLNICCDFRYVTPGAFVESGLYAGLEEKDLHDWSALKQTRAAVYRPGGPMALELAKNPTVLQVNDTVFAHGGLLPVHVNYGLEKLNQEVSAWMRAEETVDGGKALPPFLAMGGANSVMWNRTLSKELFPSQHDRYNACRALQQSLAKIGASRLIVGHTPQLSGANCECDGQVWRIDVGMSAGVLNRPVQVLQIARDPESGQDAVTVLSDSLMTNTIDEEGIPL